MGPSAGVLSLLCLTATVASPAAAAGSQHVNLAGLVERLNLTEAEIHRWLVRLGAKDGGPPAERLLALNALGEPLMERSGARSTVQIDADLDTLLRQLGMGVVLVHNHPASRGLSDRDVKHLAKAGTAAVVAIGHDGSVFAAAAGPRMSADFLDGRQYALAEEHVRRLAQSTLARSSIRFAQPHLNHMLASVLADLGFIEYWYVLRGASGESYNRVRLELSQIVAMAAARLKAGDRP
jgi:hypothetical protein